MKRLENCLKLTGKKVEEITMMELRQHPGEIMTALRYGKIYIIKRKGKKLGILRGYKK